MKPVTLAIAAFLVSGPLAEQAFSQAAAESVLTHGLASGAGSTLGKTLGNAIGNAAGQVGNRLGQQTATSPARQRVAAVRPKSGPVSTSTPAQAPTASSGSLIASIQGGSSSPVVTPACAAVMQAETSGAGKSDTGSVPSAEKSPAASKNCVSGDAAHPAVVNLPPAN